MVEKYAVMELGISEPVIYTREQILKEYYSTWALRMKSLKRDDLINEQNCIDDWIVVNWAYKVED